MPQADVQKTIFWLVRHFGNWLLREWISREFAHSLRSVCFAREGNRSKKITVQDKSIFTGFGEGFVV